MTCARRALAAGALVALVWAWLHARPAWPADEPRLRERRPLSALANNNASAPRVGSVAGSRARRRVLGGGQPARARGRAPRARRRLAARARWRDETLVVVWIAPHRADRDAEFARRRGPTAPPTRPRSNGSPPSSRGAGVARADRRGGGAAAAVARLVARHGAAARPTRSSSRARARATARSRAGSTATCSSSTPRARPRARSRRAAAPTTTPSRARRASRGSRSRPPAEAAASRSTRRGRGATSR